jgi:hypothetical protein
MTARIPRFTTEQGRKQEAALASTIERLSRLFPELSEDDVRRAVHGKYAYFDQARIRDFVPVLVENVTLDELNHRLARQRA